MDKRADKGEPSLDDRLAALRADEDYQRRLHDAMERNRGAFELLAKNDEAQEDL